MHLDYEVKMARHNVLRTQKFGNAQRGKLASEEFIDIFINQTRRQGRIIIDSSVERIVTAARPISDIKYPAPSAIPNTSAKLPSQ